MVEIEEILWRKKIQISKDREKRVRDKWARRAW